VKTALELSAATLELYMPSRKDVRASIYLLAFRQAEQKFAALFASKDWSFSLATISSATWSVKADAPPESAFLRMRKWFYERAARFDERGCYHIIAVPQYVVTIRAKAGRQPTWAGRLVLIIALKRSTRADSALEHFRFWFAGADGAEPKLEAQHLTKRTSLRNAFRQLAAIEDSDFCIVATDDPKRAECAPHDPRQAVKSSQSTKTRTYVFTSGMRLIGRKLVLDAPLEGPSSGEPKRLPKPSLLLDPDELLAASLARSTSKPNAKSSVADDDDQDDPFDGLDPPVH
jgi:hypothetical protein